MEKYRKIDEKISEGYKLLESRQNVRGCDTLLAAWEDIKVLMSEDNIKDLAALDKKIDGRNLS